MSADETPRKWSEKDRCPRCGFIRGYPYPPWESPPNDCDCRRETANPLTCPKHGESWGTVYRDGAVDYQCGCEAKAPGEKREGRPSAGAGAVPLSEAPTGIFRTLDGHYGFKTEYHRSTLSELSLLSGRSPLGAVEAYCLESGEAWWGDPPQTTNSQRAQLVTPVDFAALIAREATLRAQIALLTRALGEAADGLSRADRPSLARKARDVLGHVERGTPLELRRKGRKS